MLTCRHSTRKRYKLKRRDLWTRHNIKIYRVSRPVCKHVCISIHSFFWVLSDGLRISYRLYLLPSNKTLTIQKRYLGCDTKLHSMEMIHIWSCGGYGNHLFISVASKNTLTQRCSTCSESIIVKKWFYSIYHIVMFCSDFTILTTSIVRH